MLYSFSIASLLIAFKVLIFKLLILILHLLIFFLSTSSKSSQVQQCLADLILYKHFKCPLAPIFFTTLEVNLIELSYHFSNLLISKFKFVLIQSFIILEKNASPAPVESTSGVEQVREYLYTLLL